jgi:hypothetical protein
VAANGESDLFCERISKLLQACSWELCWNMATVRCDVMTVTQDSLYVLRTLLNILRTSHFARHSGYLNISCGLPQPLHATADKVLWKDLNRFLPNPFQFVIHQSAYLVSCQVEASPVALPTALCSQKPQTQKHWRFRNIKIQSCSLLTQARNWQTAREKSAQIS